MSLVGCCGQGADTSESLDLPKGFSLWQPSANVRAGLGYKDNVTLSSFAPVGSAFETVDAEAMLLRLPWNDWQLTAFANGSDTRYFNHDTGVDTEQNAAASAQLSWWMGKGWKSSSTLQYVFVNQVMDVSVTYGVPLRQQVFGHGIIAKQGLQKDLGFAWAQVDASLGRYFFREPLDSYWQPAAALTFGRYYGQGSEVSLAYQLAPLLYDSREQTDARGTPIAETQLEFLPQTIELSWMHYWDQQQHWRTHTRLQFELNQDNGSGYYNYTQCRLVEQLRFRTRKWEVSLRLALAWYSTPNQQVSLTDPTARERTSVQIGLRAERTLSRHWKVYAAYDLEQSFSNLESDSYHANTASTGVELAF